MNSRRNLRRSATVRRTPNAVVSRRIISLNLSASASAHKHREQHAGPVLLHLDRRVENVQRARRQRRFDEVAENFSADVVEIRFQHRDAIVSQSSGRPLESHA